MLTYMEISPRWTSDGLPYKPKPESDKKREGEEKKLPMWL